MFLSFRQFLHIGREQRHVQRNPLAALFYTLLGPLSIHARLRVSNMIRAAELLNLPDQIRVLDAGSGYGYTIVHLARRHPGWQCRGVELEARHVADGRRIAEAEGLGNLSFVCASLVTHVETPNSYDLIVSGDVLEHIVEDEQALANMRHWLRPGGWLILHLPLRHQLQQRIFPHFHRHTIADHVRDEYTEDEIRDKLSRAGFHVKRLVYSYGILGELAIELNWFFWSNTPLRLLTALLTLPVTLPLAYLDFKLPKQRGNGLLIEAYKPFEESE